MNLEGKKYKLEWSSDNKTNEKFVKKPNNKET